MSARLFRRSSRGNSTRLRAGDRFFWQNQEFDPDTAAMISNTTLADILLRNTDTTNLQPHVFIEANYPVTHARRHVQMPTSISRHGRKNPLRINDGM